MSQAERGVRLHDTLTCMGWIAGPQAHALAYWSMRLADEIQGVGKYAVAHRALREEAWNGIRPFDVREYAVTSRYAYAMQQFLGRHEHRFSSKYDQSVREIRKAIQSIQTVAPITGRTKSFEEALAA